MAMPSAFDNFYQVSGDLFRRFPPTSPGLSFSHIETDLAPTEVLRRLRLSVAAPALLVDGRLANRPERFGDWEILPIHASEGSLRRAGVRVSFWGPPAWNFRAASLDVRLVFGGDPWAAEEVSLYWSETGGPRLTRVVFDSQRAETGYEGDDRLSIELTPEHVETWSGLIGELVGSSPS